MFDLECQAQLRDAQLRDAQLHDAQLRDVTREVVVGYTARSSPSISRTSGTALLAGSQGRGGNAERARRVSPGMTAPNEPMNWVARWPHCSWTDLAVLLIDW